MNRLVKDAYIYFLEHNKQSLHKIDKESLIIFIRTMMDTSGLSRCFCDHEYAENIRNRYRWYEELGSK